MRRYLSLSLRLLSDDVCVILPAQVQGQTEAEPTAEKQGGADDDDQNLLYFIITT